jgi:hypothetical protein
MNPKYTHPQNGCFKKTNLIFLKRVQVNLKFSLGLNTICGKSIERLSIQRKPTSSIQPTLRIGFTELCRGSHCGPLRQDTNESYYRPGR